MRRSEVVVGPHSADRLREDPCRRLSDREVGPARSQMRLGVSIEGGTGKVIGRYVKKNLWISER
jgi:hypothetical protein